MASILAGPTWRDTAVAVREALRQGQSLEQVAGRAGIAVRVLHQWLVACDVYDGLDTTVIGGALRPRLDEDEAAEILYALRQLPRDDRSAAARYLLERGLPAAAAEGLVQAIKDCRRLGREAPFDAFTCEPGNALAFRKWRRARFAGDPGERRRCLEEGLALAETETVRALFRQALNQEIPMPGRPRPAPPRLPVRSSGADALWPRPVPYFDNPALLGRTFQMAPPVPAGGPPVPVQYLPAGRYVTLPPWPEVARLRWPAAISWAAPALPFPLGPAAASAGDRTVLLVVETWPADPEPEPGAVILVRQDDAVRVVVAGSATSADCGAVLGRVVLALRRGTEISPDGEADTDADLDFMG